MFAASCVSSQLPDDDLGEETTADGEEGKGDGAAAFTYFQVDTYRGLYRVSRVNRSTTQCAPEIAEPDCKIQALDWSRTELGSIGAVYENRLLYDETLLMRGTLAPTSDGAGRMLVVREVWTASSQRRVEGVFTLVKDNGLKCVAAPCANLTERRLNSNLSAAISTIDFDASNEPREGIEGARVDLSWDPGGIPGNLGLIVVGYRITDDDGGKGRSAEVFYSRDDIEWL